MRFTPTYAALFILSKAGDSISIDLRYGILVAHRRQFCIIPLDIAVHLTADMEAMKGHSFALLSLTSISNHLLGLALSFRQPSVQHVALALQVCLISCPVTHGFFVLCHQLGTVAAAPF